jgi:hypothetical protein
MRSDARKRNRAPKPRVEDFQGPSAKYIEFLEERYYQFQTRNHLLETLLQQWQQQARGQLPAPVQCNVPSTLKILIETPESQAPKAPVSSATVTNSELKQLISKLPKTNDDWSARRKLTRLDTIAELLDAFCKLTRISSQSRSLAIGERPADTASILEVLRDYDSFAIALVGEKIYATQISNYGALLFTCVAIVALKAGADPEAVYERLKAFLIAQQGRSKADSTHLKSVLEGALWVVSQMNELYSKGLKHRSWDLFLLCTSYKPS